MIEVHGHGFPTEGEGGSGFSCVKRMPRGAAVALRRERCRRGELGVCRLALADVLTKLVGLWPAARIDELMPWTWDRAQRTPIAA